MRVPYPRTPHLPWSPGVASDDVRAGGLAGLVGREVVVTEKLDGENTTLYQDGTHARSLDSAHHPSRAWIKALHGRIARFIPPGRRVCGENLYARHSIEYRDLESWFYAFSVWDGDHCLDWDRTARLTRRLGVPVPPVLWRGVFDERALRALRLDTARQEGYVVRTVDGFHREEFAHRVAKWVRPRHVQTTEHWMLAPVVENGLGPVAALWDVRSGADPDVPALLTATGVTAGADPKVSALLTATGVTAGDLAGHATPEAAGVHAATAPPGWRFTAGGPARPAPPEAAVERAEAAVADVSARLDLLGRTGDARLEGVMAALFQGTRRAWLAPALVAPLGMPLARRVADLVELHPRLHRDFPDEARRTGLVRLAVAADLGVLHAVAAAALAGRADDDAADAREQVAWSELHADEAGLLGEAPLEPLRLGLRQALGDCEPEVADRCWAETREAYALGRITTAEGGLALSRRWRSGGFPRLVVMVGPSGSGKSTFAGNLTDTGAVVALDDLRQARGSRSDQRANPAILREGLHRLDALLAAGGTVVWDATALNRHQRSLVHTVARGRDALTTQAVMLVPGDLLARRNASRTHPVPPEVLSAQLRRFSPPCAGETHRTWYIGPEGDVLDVAGALDRDGG
ncbi:AAA family ATPase [Streptosporangium sp. NBC_01495]|uniref:RNA ligase family protein n=1 Tax=Streptosporangium sp. NBC_01495 TaxID=2903899 RepID=UPI002E33554C|nr:RNA ligase family protein [Streptosporangium sp. NBC_01495]